MKKKQWNLTLLTPVFQALFLSALLSVTAIGTTPPIQPILTRTAETAQSITLDGNFRYFEDVKLEEADRFDGLGLDLELTAPFRETMQLRFVLPAYTYGTARLIDPPTLERIRIKGPGGTFDYPTILVDHQILKERDHGYNLAYFLGSGMTWGPWGKLNTTHGDIYNHQGHLLRLGVKADRRGKRGGIHWLGNLGIRAYLGSDDLNPAETGDDFVLVEATGAAVFDAGNNSIHPAMEVKFRGDLDRYHALHLIPQVIVPIHPHVEIKAGVPFRVTSDGEKWGFRFQVSSRF